MKASNAEMFVWKIKTKALKFLKWKVLRSKVENEKSFARNNDDTYVAHINELLFHAQTGSVINILRGI